MNKPMIVCICGSTRFKQEFIDANLRETMKGKIVLTVGCFRHTEKEPPTEEECRMLDELHLRKIDLADEVLILNVGSYIGKGTFRELQYAYESKKKIRFLEPDQFDRIELHEFVHRLGKYKIIDSLFTQSE